MRAVVQRVQHACVEVDGVAVAQIDAGLLVLLAVTHSDTPSTAAAMARKLAGLRILRDGDRDECGAVDIKAAVLVVSQFTLYGDTTAGRRPGWGAAAPGSVAEPLIDLVVAGLRNMGLSVQTGVFGATMAVTSTNDGPMTLVVDLP